MLDGEGSTLHDHDKYTFITSVHVGLNRAESRCLCIGMATAVVIANDEIWALRSDSCCDWS